MWGVVELMHYSGWVTGEGRELDDQQRTDITGPVNVFILLRTGETFFGFSLQGKSMNHKY